MRPASISARTITPKVQKDLKTSSTKSNRKRVSKAKTSDVFDSTSETKEKTSRRKKRLVGEINLIKCIFSESTPIKTLPEKQKIGLNELEKLSTVDQLAVDFTNEPHPSGTRIFALWGNEVKIIFF